MSHQFAAAADARPNTMSRPGAQDIAALLPSWEKELVWHLQQLAA
ncbi:hypothetical protein AB0F46_04445 [Streptomyces sp. NPDC026665]